MTTSQMIGVYGLITTSFLMLLAMALLSRHNTLLKLQVERMQEWLDEYAEEDDHAAFEIERLRGALQEISNAGGDMPPDVLLAACIKVARAALAEQELK